MIFFPRFRTLRTSRPKGTITQRLARGVMLGCILALVIWAFNANLRNRLDKVRKDAVVRDEVGLISEKDRKQFGDLSQAFEKNFGVALSIRILRGEPPAPGEETPMRAIIISLYPQQNAARINLPPLVLTAVGEPLRRELEQQYLALGLERGYVVEGLVKTLKVIWERIGGGQSAGPPGG